MKGQIIRQKYKVIKILGRDSCTETFLARGIGRDCFKRYAIKKFRPILANPQAKETKHLFDREANTLEILGNNNSQIPRLCDRFREQGDFYLVREWIEGTTLKQKVQQQGKLAETEVVEILKGILSALQYIHDCNLVYGELSPSGIVLRQNKGWKEARQEDGLPVLIYFGNVRQLKRETQKLNRRSLIFANQTESVFSPPEEQQVAYANDFYGLGLIAIYLLTGKNPAEFNVNPHTGQLLWHRELDRVSSSLVRAIDRAICPRISDRFISSQEMSKALFPQSITISESLVTQPRLESQLRSEIKIVAILLSLGLGVMVATWAILNLDLEFSLVKENAVDFIEPDREQNLPSTSDSSSEIDEEIPPAAVLNLPVFRVGTSQQDLISSLGKPTRESKGYWGETRAFLYKNFIPQVDLGYLVDIESKRILQTEVSFPKSIAEVEVQHVLRQLLMTDYSTEIETKVQQVTEQNSDLQEFSTDNLEGIIQRNLQNRVYVAVWNADFH